MRAFLLCAVILSASCGGATPAPAESEASRETEPVAEAPATETPPASASGTDCVTPWYLDPARGPDTLTCRAAGDVEVSTDCEACTMRPAGDCFADLPGDTVERRALDGTHHTFPASHTCIPECCTRDRLTPLPPVAR